VPYGTEFATQQEVFDFLIGYGRWLSSQGWAFEDTVEETGEAKDWLSSAKDFLFWTLARWQAGTAMAVSPAAKLVTFRRDHGEVQAVEQVIQGVYSLLNRDGTMVPPRATTVLSITTCRTRRVRFAPSASLTASSRRRAALRESSRLPALTQALNSNKPVEPSTTMLMSSTCARAAASSREYAATLNRRGSDSSLLDPLFVSG
jgi:hypothetical protein